MPVDANRATGYKVLAVDWNSLAALANSNEAAITNVSTGNAALNTRLSTVETKVTGLGTDSNTTTGTASAQLTDLRSRASTLETRTTGLGTTTNVTTGTASAQLGDLRSRATALETLTGGATTGNAALGTRVTTLEAGASAPPSCVLTRSTNWNYPGNDVTYLWSTAEQNDSVGGNPMWSAGSPNVITIRQSGLYDIGANVHFAAVDERCTASITKNLDAAQAAANTLCYVTANGNSGFTAGTTLVVGRLVRLVAGDVLRVIVFCGTPNVSMVNNSFAGPSSFWATYVRS